MNHKISSLKLANQTTNETDKYSKSYDYSKSASNFEELEYERDQNFFKKKRNSNYFSKFSFVDNSYADRSHFPPLGDDSSENNQSYKDVEYGLLDDKSKSKYGNFGREEIEENNSFENDLNSNLDDGKFIEENDIDYRNEEDYKNKFKSVTRSNEEKSIMIIDQSQDNLLNSDEIESQLKHNNRESEEYIEKRDIKIRKIKKRRKNPQCDNTISESKISSIKFKPLPFDNKKKKIIKGSYSASIYNSKGDKPEFEFPGEHQENQNINSILTRFYDAVNCDEDMVKKDCIEDALFLIDFYQDYIRQLKIEIDFLKRNSLKNKNFKNKSVQTSVDKDTLKMKKMTLFTETIQSENNYLKDLINKMNLKLTEFEIENKRLTTFNKKLNHKILEIQEEVKERDQKDRDIRREKRSFSRRVQSRDKYRDIFENAAKLNQKALKEKREDSKKAREQKKVK